MMCEDGSVWDKKQRRCECEGWKKCEGDNISVRGVLAYSSEKGAVWIESVRRKSRRKSRRKEVRMDVGERGYKME